MKKILAVLILSAMLTACGADGQTTSSPAAPDGNSQETSAAVSEAEAETEAETPPSAPALTPAGEVIFNEQNVKLIGRTHIIDNTLWCAFSGTGADFIYKGKGLEITIAGDSASMGSADSRARVAIFVNGERVADEMIDSLRKTFKVAESDEITESEIKIVKLSETAHSTIGIMPAALGDGESITPAEPKKLKMEFIGDSITCGYGVDDEVKEHHFSTATEDVTKAYAYKTAELMDAEYSMVSISGWGIISGYTNNPDKKSDGQVIPKYYGKMGYSYNKFANSQAPQDIDWDFSRYVPDVVVINLGTNDASYCKNDKEKREEYRDAYIDFIGQVRENNPDAEIFCVLGLMGADLFNDMGEAALMYSEEHGDDKVHFLQLPVQDGNLGYAADWHPTEANHRIAAEYLAGEIKAVIGADS